MWWLKKKEKESTRIPRALQFDHIYVITTNNKLHTHRNNNGISLAFFVFFFSFISSVGPIISFFFHPLELSQTRTPTDILSLRLFSKTQIMFQCGNKGNSFSYLNNKVGSIWLFVIIIYLFFRVPDIGHSGSI